MKRNKLALMILVMALIILCIMFAPECPLRAQKAQAAQKDFRVDQKISIAPFSKDSSQISFTVHNLLDSWQAIHLLVEYERLDKHVVRGKYEGPKVQNIFHYLAPYETLNYSLNLPNGSYKIRVYNKSWQKDLIPKQKIALK